MDLSISQSIDQSMKLRFAMETFNFNLQPLSDMPASPLMRHQQTSKNKDDFDEWQTQV